MIISISFAFGLGSLFKVSWELTIWLRLAHVWGGDPLTYNQNIFSISTFPKQSQLQAKQVKEGILLQQEQ